MKISHAQYKAYFANKCSVCKGVARVVEDGVRKECICQKKARHQYRFQQINIYPSKLKEKDWLDFTGVISKGDQITGNLTVESAIEARNKAFQYCYGVPFDEEVLKNRVSSLRISERLHDGQNLVISGDEATGRSLLGAIVCKEVCNVCLLHNKNLDYRWIRFYDILNAARWVYDQQGHHKAVDHVFLDMLASLHFLFIDGIDLQRGGKNYPADHIAMDGLFGHRTMYALPTILITSKSFLKGMATASGQDRLANLFGYEFLQMILRENTVVIELVKDNAR